MRRLRWISLGRLLTSLLCGVGILSSILWLVGYARAIGPFIFDGVPDGLASLEYPQIKWYTELDETSGRISEMKIDWFSVSDGPTGVVYAHRYFPCWIVSVAAALNLVGSAVAIAQIFTEHRYFGAWQERLNDPSRSGT